MNAEAIIQGFKNFKFPSPEIEILATERAKVCGACDEIIERPLLKFVPGLSDEKNPDIKHAACGICNCILSAKVRQLLESCPHPDGNKWPDYKSEKI